MDVPPPPPPPQAGPCPTPGRGGGGGCGAGGGAPLTRGRARWRGGGGEGGSPVAPRPLPPGSARGRRRGLLRGSAGEEPPPGAFIGLGASGGVTGAGAAPPGTPPPRPPSPPPLPSLPTTLLHPRIPPSILPSLHPLHPQPSSPHTQPPRPPPAPPGTGSPPRGARRAGEALGDSVSARSEPRTPQLRFAPEGKCSPELAADLEPALGRGSSRSHPSLARNPSLTERSGETDLGCGVRGRWGAGWLQADLALFPSPEPPRASLCPGLALG